MVCHYSSHLCHQGSRPNARLGAIICPRELATSFCCENCAAFIACWLKWFIADFDLFFQAKCDSLSAATRLVVCYLRSFLSLRRLWLIFDFYGLHQGLLSFCQALKLIFDFQFAQWWWSFYVDLVPKVDRWEKNFFTPLFGATLPCAKVPGDHFPVFDAICLRVEVFRLIQWVDLLCLSYLQHSNTPASCFEDFSHQISPRKAHYSW